MTRRPQPKVRLARRPIRYTATADSIWTAPAVIAWGIAALMLLPFLADVVKP